MTQPERLEFYKKIVKLRKSGLSYGKIGKIVGKGAGRVRDIAIGTKPRIYKCTICEVKIIDRGVMYCTQCRSKMETGLLNKRFLIFQKYNFTCIYCGRSPQNSGVQLMVDHLKPKARGGSERENNLVAACSDCNFGKADILLDKHNAYKFRQWKN